MNEINHDLVKVVLDLKGNLVQEAIRELAQFKFEHPTWKEEISCPFDDLCRELNDVIRMYFNEIQAKGMKIKAARACAISRKTQERYEKYVPK